MTFRLEGAQTQFLDNNGDPLAGGSVEFYEAGTSTPKDTYTDSAQSATNANPVTLDAAGRAAVYLDGDYKVIVKDSAGVTIYTQDNVSTPPTSAEVDAAVEAALVVPIFETIAAAGNESVAATIKRVRIAGFSDATGGGGGEYVRVDADPDPALSFRSQDRFISDGSTDASNGGYWKLDPTAPVFLEQAGAVGDGTTDDSDKIQACIDSGAKIIRGTPGKTYRIGGQNILMDTLTGVTLDFTGCDILIGAAPSQTISGTGSEPVAIKFDTCTDCHLVGASVDGNNVVCGVVGLESCIKCTVSHNVIDDAGNQNGVVLVGGAGTGNRIKRNTISGANSTARGIWGGNVTSGNIENDLYIIGNRISGTAATAIKCEANGFVISENICSNTVAGSGIIFGGANSLRSENGVIVGNVCRGCAGTGIQCDVVLSSDADRPINIAITGNVCEGNGQNGIALSNCRRVSASGNMCLDNGVAGIQAVNSFDISISGNNCSDSRSGASRTQATGVDIRANSATDITNISIRGNTCNNNTDIGVQVVTVSGSTIDGLVVSDNIAIDNDDRGILIAPGGTNEILNGTVVGNVCRGSTTDLRVTSDTILADNNIYDTELGVTGRDFADGDTTPSVQNRKYWSTANTGATSITDFDDGAPGQEIYITAGDANTTLVNGASLVTTTGGNVALADGQVTALKLDAAGTAWRQLW